MLTSGRCGMVMMRTVAENRGSCLVRRLANSTVGTRFPMAGVEVKTNSNLVMLMTALLVALGCGDG